MTEVMIQDMIDKLAAIDLFARDKNTGGYATGTLVGRPFYLDYDRAFVLANDAWKLKANGIPQGAFLLAYYDNEENVNEALLLRVLKPAKLPTDTDIVRSMVEYYKDNLNTSGAENQLDALTRYEFSFSGVECRILGTFYRDPDGRTCFGADVENFYSSHNYTVVKPRRDVLELIVNFKEDGIVGKPTDIRIGKVRYSSSRRFQAQEEHVPVYVSPADFLGKRTALFGMTRTGKSNTVKKIIQATVSISDQAVEAGDSSSGCSRGDEADPFFKNGIPKQAVGQIVFDINGEYANANLQDEGTAVFEIYKDRVNRYSTIEKDGFNVMKVNFYEDVLSGFELVRAHLTADDGDYVQNFCTVDLSEPSSRDVSTVTRHRRRLAAYLCCLFRAGFEPPNDFKVEFAGNAELNRLVSSDGRIDPSKGISLSQAVDWFTAVWNQYDNAFFSKYKSDHGHEWADEDLKALLVFLTKTRKPGGRADVSGFIKLRGAVSQHSSSAERAFEEQIIDDMRTGKIVIVDLSQGDPAIQSLYSERICRKIFASAMNRFISNEPNNFIQFYFEEAHNLFPRREDKDLTQIYNRIAKEGAKLNLGLVYATQEVSSISSNILKNTQNWFISHLNNEDEMKEIRKYYDFDDFADSLVRFSASSDKGFVRMKAYSNSFVVPVQIDRFSNTIVS